MDDARKAADALEEAEGFLISFDIDMMHPRADEMRAGLASALTKAHARGQAEMRAAAALVADAKAIEWQKFRDGWSSAADAVSEAIRALPLSSPAPVPRVRVKPLKWRDHTFHESFLLIAASRLHEDYRITRDEACDWPYILRPYIAGQSNYQTPEAAKAAAQADYAARILSALDLPAPPKEETDRE